jgi:DNA-binding CsgD family transcriptional regulator
MGHTSEIALFYYTLVILLAAVLAAATCFSSFLVSHRRAPLLAFFGFLFYFFDVTLVFLDDYILRGPLDHATPITDPYFIGSPFASILIGGGVIVSFWLFLCEYIKEKRPWVMVVPGAWFVVGSIIMLAVVPEGNWQVFLFYSMRSITLFGILIYLAVRYASKRDDVERILLKRHRKFYLILWIFGLGVLMENIVFLLLLEPDALPFFPERNFMENALLLCCMFAAYRDSYRSLSLRFEKPPSQGNESFASCIEQKLTIYGKLHHLSARECEVLNLVILGMDNQNIASSLHLALSTVKVHVHKILHKTEMPNRQLLIRDFWKAP